MATATKQSSQPTPKARQYKQGSLYINEDSCVYLCTDEGSFVEVFRVAKGNIGIMLSDGLPDAGTLEPFVGSVTLTEGL